MVAYIQQIAKDVAARFEWPQKSEGPAGRAADTIDGRVAILREELDRLDPRHFTPEARYEFTEVRRLVRDLDDEARPPWSAELQRWEHAEKEAARLAIVISEIEAGTRPPTTTPTHFQELRQTALNDARHGQRTFQEAVLVCERACRVLDCFTGRGGDLSPRDFTFVCNTALRVIIERDYRELAQVLFPEGRGRASS